jgi:ADP-heptose:LPS heptosyltransferase
MKNWLSLQAAKLGDKLAHNESRAGRFLIVSTTGLGDTLWATPAIRALRQKYPSCFLAVLTSGVGAGVLKNNPHIDDLISLAKTPLLMLIPRLRKEKIETIFVFHASQRIIYPLTHWVGATRIIGTHGINKGLDVLLTEAREAKPIHEIQRRLELVDLKQSDSQMELFPSLEDRKKANSVLSHISAYHPIVGLHVGAKDGFKQWPKESFVEVGQRLQNHLGAQIVVTGGSDEIKLVKEITGQIPGSLPMAGNLSVLELAALIEKMSLFITNDTGPMHIAYAMKRPTLSLFAPTNPLLCGPYLAPKTLAIKKPVTCSPCLKKKCRDPFCMRQISADDVFNAALKLYYG